MRYMAVPEKIELGGGGKGGGGGVRDPSGGGGRYRPMKVLLKIHYSTVGILIVLVLSNRFLTRSLWSQQCPQLHQHQLSVVGKGVREMEGAEVNLSRGWEVQGRVMDYSHQNKCITFKELQLCSKLLQIY